MYLFDNRITLESQTELDKYLKSYEYKCSSMSFSSLFMWRDINHFSYEVIGDYLCIAGISYLQLDEETPFLFPPMTATGDYDSVKLRETILEAKRRFEEKGYKFKIRLLPLHMVDVIQAAFPKDMLFIADRPNYDYVYKTQDLVELKGRDLHSKKNHLNYFKNHYIYEYITLTSAMADECMDFIREFNERKVLPPDEKQFLFMEERAMSDVLNNLEKLGYLAGAILIEGKIEAFCIGGYLGKKTITVHVEKGNTEYRGIYQAINNEFCKRVPPHITRINREEDMGIAGLRKAKLSYKPYKLTEMHIGIFKSDYKGL